MAETTPQATAPAGDKPQITLYWLEQSRAQRVVWLLEECKGADYNIEVFKRGKDMLAGPELKKIHPLGKSPVISVKSSNTPQPIVIAESGTLTEYLVDHFAEHLQPTRYQAGKEKQVGGETEEWLRYRFYMHYAEGSLMSILLIGLFMDQIKNAPVPFFIKPITRTIAGRVEDQFLNRNYDAHFGFLEKQLETSPNGGQWLTGKDLTAADILMSFPLIAGKSKIDATKFPKLTALIKRYEEHPGYLASIKKIEEVTGEKFQPMMDARK